MNNGPKISERRIAARAAVAQFRQTVQRLAEEAEADLAFAIHPVMIETRLETLAKDVAAAHAEMKSAAKVHDHA